ncbi:hypothetical protein BCR44DRAFT_1083069 [Catenaria anguillulae PL171]|uniref:Transmembrane protein n=1 Tax=Catenaria anguillulae PL171 TaxID=765915 RepID=A0A1Y2HQB2_9FUNG|nr:hypothetical protein BCR44DRAFT_1083069 [Catenaria anguillulae PL171]
MEQMNQLRTNSLPRAVALLPLLADDETQLSAALRSEMLVRVFTPVFTQQSTDFIADDVSPVDLVTKIVNAANLVVSAYAAPTSLSTQVFNSTLEFRFMAENFAAIVFGIMQLGLSSVREYNALVRTNMAIVSSCAVVALCAVFTTALVMYKKMLKRFLNYEDRILALLQHMPEGIAASVKSQLEERIKFVSEAESPMTGASTATSSKWKSIVGGDADEYDVVTGTEADPNDLESEGQAGLSGRKAPTALACWLPVCCLLPLFSERLEPR